MGAGSDWIARRLAGSAPPAPVPAPPAGIPTGYRPVGYQQPGQAYYQPPAAPLVTPAGPQSAPSDGLLEERESTLLLAARSAQATGGSRGAKEHMRDCPECGRVLYVTTRTVPQTGAVLEHAHCYNCGYQPGVRDGSAVAAARAGGRGGGRVAPSRQYDPAAHAVTVVGDGVIGPKGAEITFEPNRRE